MTKKTASIEIRISPEDKQALADRCQEEGASMSSFVRDVLFRELNPQTQTDGEHDMSRMKSSIGMRMGLASLPVLALAGVYLVSSNQMAVASAEDRMAFAELDRNGDGLLSQQEYEGMAEFDDDMAAEDSEELPAACSPYAASLTASHEQEMQEMHYLDLNGDTMISYEEFAKAMHKERLEIFREFDANADGFVTEAEVLKQMQPPSADKLAVELGIDQDCAKALIAMEEAWEAEFKQHMQDELTPQQEARIFIAAYDDNRDGQVSQAELSVN
jgi:Ca2+-binding EF-hand superfamily protein